MNDYPNTAPTKRPGLRMTPGLLSGAMAVLVLMVFTIVFLATRQPPPAPVITQVSARTSRPTEEATEPGTPPPASPTEQPSTSEPVPTGEAKFTKEVDPCKLVGEDLRVKLVLFPKETKIYKEECEWGTLPRFGAGIPDNMYHKLKVYTKVFTGGVAEAHEQFVARRGEAALIPKGYTKPDPIVGDDSFVTGWTLPGDTGKGPTTAVVGVRVSNAVIEVTYDRRVTEDPEGRLTRGAMEVAKAVADKLSSGAG